ncbi:LLM class flavin-dependent oxidoreductase [Nocardioides panacisoli]|uniref:LLM class flavin-dependent oxidoreductase n=1 Tax=Nocardioides panacisoli TaxID=627624 RepID=UPI001C62F9E1|nr:LLM class flavin-dependent oxidoreductase [Nocardioides panacisoli]QYJ03616.1 LLM class flavin-dependent oxidoreductase [Nocardioides panacisoli]
MDTGIACAFVAHERPLAEAISAAAAAAERHGLRTWWALGDREIAAGRSHDPTLCLQRVARATASLRVALSGDLVAARGAALRAKQLATLAWFAGGRLEIGLDLDDAPDTLALPDVAAASGDALVTDRLLAMRALWSEDRASYAGSSVAFDGAIALPKPPGRGLRWHVRPTDTDRLAGVIATAGAPDGWLHWHGDAAGLATAADQVAAAHGPGAEALQCTWFVDADRFPEVCDAADRAGVSELVAVFEHVPDPAEITALVEGQHA